MRREIRGGRTWLLRALGVCVLSAYPFTVSANGVSATGEDPASDARPLQLAPDAGADGEHAPCGSPGMPACPLQAWMRANVAAPLAMNDLPALANGLERAAKLVPDATWSSWTETARAGAAAARKGDVAATRASCRACHGAWREAYRAKYRLRPIEN